MHPFMSYRSGTKDDYNADADDDDDADDGVMILSVDHDSQATQKVKKTFCSGDIFREKSKIV